MNRFLLVVALVAAGSIPALAGSGKERANDAYPTPSWVLPLPRSERLAKALGGWNRGYPADSHASLIRGIGVLALAAATVRSPRVSISGGLCASAREPIFAWESAPRFTAPDIYFS